MNRIAVCPGSFDPVTLGHIDIFLRTAEIFDSVVVLVMQNAKKKSVFTPEERCRIIKSAIGNDRRISVTAGSGICADFARELGACAIVKGVRSPSDFDYETDIAIINRGLNAPETLFLPANPIYRHVSTSTALHLFSLGADVSAYLPPAAIEALNSSPFGKDR
ncbi:MAG: pantetheine-phosphate adenylyltransferase [Clostridia bacterium]|nr:pantetheine-phosphate adenylyltransferase [Clostridia bacterium]